MSDKADRVSVRAPFSHALHVCVGLAAHGLQTAFFLLVIWCVEHVMEFFWHGHDPVFFDRIPLHYFVQGADAAVLLVFAVKGAILVARGSQE